MGPSTGRSRGERGPCAKRRSRHHRPRLGRRRTHPQRVAPGVDLPGAGARREGPSTYESTGSIVAAVDPFHAHSKPGELDLAILAHAHDLQTRTRATLSALHCFVPFEYFGSDLTTPVGDAFAADARREEVEKLLRQAGLQAAAARIENGPTHEVIRKLVDRGEADVVVMGVLARGRIKDWLIGSTAERVLHGVPVDVLAVKTRHLR